MPIGQSPSNCPSSAEPQCKLVLDGWRDDLAEWILTDAAAKPLRECFLDLSKRLASIVDTPGSVRLVIAVNLAEAVRRRSGGAAYDIGRGSGMVGGRTMTVDDGIDVVIDGNWLVDVDADGTPVLRESGAKMMRRTIAHEAQHVVMEQRGSSWDAYGRADVGGWIRVLVFDIAAKMCDEHRAEWNSRQLADSDPTTKGDVLDVLAALGKQLESVSEAYQQTHDVRALMEGALGACETFWTAIAYWAAEYRYGDTVDPLPTEFTDLNLWRRYIGDGWDEIARSLSRLPVAELTTSPDVLHDAAKVLAGVLDTVHAKLGFEYVDDPEPRFFIRRFDFPSARS